ncbi:hypothetical protein BKA80DRAFT_65843 [Phyllosticta citrichinensis]
MVLVVVTSLTWSSHPGNTGRMVQPTAACMQGTGLEIPASLLATFLIPSANPVSQSGKFTKDICNRRRPSNKLIVGLSLTRNPRANNIVVLLPRRHHPSNIPQLYPATRSLSPHVPTSPPWSWSLGRPVENATFARLIFATTSAAVNLRHKSRWKRRAARFCRHSTRGQDATISRSRAKQCAHNPLTFSPWHRHQRAASRSAHRRPPRRGKLPPQRLRTPQRKRYRSSSGKQQRLDRDPSAHGARDDSGPHDGALHPQASPREATRRPHVSDLVQRVRCAGRAGPLLPPQHQLRPRPGRPRRLLPRQRSVHGDHSRVKRCGRIQRQHHHLGDGGEQHCARDDDG